MRGVSTCARGAYRGKKAVDVCVLVGESAQ